MSALSPGEIGEIRDELADFYPDEAVIQRRTTANDDWGSAGAAYAAAETVPVRVALLSSRELARLASEGSIIDSSLVFPAETDVRQTDRVVVAGRTYEVVSIASGGSWEVQRRVMAQEVK